LGKGKTGNGFIGNQGNFRVQQVGLLLLPLIEVGSGVQQGRLTS